MGLSHFVSASWQCLAAESRSPIGMSEFSLPLFEIILQIPHPTPYSQNTHYRRMALFGALVEEIRERVFMVQARAANAFVEHSAILRGNQTSVSQWTIYLTPGSG